MRIDIHGSMFPISEELETHIARRVEIALRRVADRVESVVLLLADLSVMNGAREKRCRISARFTTPLRSIKVEATDTDAYVAVSQAAVRLEAAVLRAVSPP